MEPKKTAIIGGTFNPVHTGHLYLAELIFSETDIERILYIPVNTPSHKAYINNVTADQRIAMLKTALDDFLSEHSETVLEGKEILVDDCDIQRGGISYTFDTIDHVIRNYAIEGKLSFVIGDDLAAGLDTWYKWDELKNRIRFIIAMRDGKRKQDQKFQHAVNLSVLADCDATILQNRVIDISSSRIRDMLLKGEDVSALLPQRVLQHIRDHGLYGIT